ncbi:MAG: PASTA domain-containing protein, partial [Planctomycetota bacterium]|nr:PASTA domain-containing protein [Planctomycetota bacterium]
MKIRNSLVVCLTTLVVTAFSGTAHAADGTVPDCVGLELAKAQSMLESAGFQVTIEPAPGRTIGLVFSQVPGGFALASKGSAVTLHVGGPTPKPGPSVEPAAPRDPAPREPAPREPAPREPAPRDPDGGQEGPISTPEDLGAPPAGAGAVPVDPGVRLPPVQPRVPTETPTMRAATGSTALVYQGRAIPPGTLPNVNGPELPGVIGRSVQQATAALRPWNVLVEYMLAMPEFVGQVINQVPYAGTTLAQGQNVTIVVAIAKSKPDATFVPQAQGKEWTDACESTTRAGLVPVPRSVVSMASERGKVLLQSPQSGSLVAPGSQVTLLVGRGPGAYSAEVEDSGSAEPAPVEPLPAGPTPLEP